MNRAQYFNKLSALKNENDFNEQALQVFNYQVQYNKIYSRFVRTLKINPGKINSITDIPFLPVEFFKSEVVLTGNEKYRMIFSSSGTTSEIVSRHFVRVPEFYEKVFTETFRIFYGDPLDYVIIALLPSYLEREGSSLVYMMNNLIRSSKKKESGFYLNNHKKLFSVLERLRQENKKTILFGVTYALLDFAEKHTISFPELLVMETGGMKGRREELVREEVHNKLRIGFDVNKIHSEYGMTELLSQAYSKGDGIFNTPHWMRVIIRDPYDPLKQMDAENTGGINVIDLANIDSCAFIATQDLGRTYIDNSFEVLGRFDFSEIRGCNLMVD
jgi:hypothetical protein